MTNITVLIGENGIGKTRFLEKKAEESINNNLRIVTNLLDYNIYNSEETDDKKLKDIDYVGNHILSELNKLKVTDKNSDAQNMFKLVITKGDVLLLDEVDVNMTYSDITGIMSAIADSRNHWKEIYISGYNVLLSRVFVDTDKEDYTTIYNPNYCFVRTIGDDVVLEHITEDDANEYFDSI